MKRICWAIGLFLIWFNAYARNQKGIDIENLLSEGPIILVKQASDGKFAYASSLVYVHAPPEIVWNVILDLNHYCEFMPRVKISKIKSISDDGKEIIAHFELTVPLMNQRYDLKYSLDYDKKTIHINQVAGDLKGSWWCWKIEAYGKGTLARYWGATKNYSALLQRFEDERQTVTIGINVSSMMTVTRTIKQRSEKLYAEKQ